MNFLKDKVNKHKVLTTILVIVLIVGLIAGGLFITRNKNNSLIEMADSSGAGAIEVPEGESSEPQVTEGENGETTPQQDNVEDQPNAGSGSNQGQSGGEQNTPRNSQQQAPSPNSGNANGGQSTPAPQTPSTPQPSQPQQQAQPAPSRPQWKKVIVGYCDVTIGDDFNQSYKNAEACFQKVLPEKPVWCGVSYWSDGVYTCDWKNELYCIDAYTNYVYYEVRA